MRQTIKDVFQGLLEHLRPSLKDDTPQNDIYLELEKAIGYSFQDRSLLQAALTHNSYLRKFDRDKGNSFSPFERMEFLGDAVLGLVVSEELFTRFPNEREGYMSKLKSKIVSERYLSQKAQIIGLGKCLSLSQEEERQGGRERRSILADAMESLLCGIYLDGGIRAARSFVKKIVIKGFEELTESDELANFKSTLQEYSQQLYQRPPSYRIAAETGPEHSKSFSMEVFLNGKLVGFGVGGNKKDAEQAAACDACHKLGILN